MDRNWNKKYRAKLLQNWWKVNKYGSRHQLMLAMKDLLVKKDVHSFRYWVQVGDSMLRRNRKHKFI